MAAKLTAKTDLLDLALSGHGGLDRWEAIDSLTATIALSGALFELKGRPEGLGDSVRATVSTAVPRVEFAPLPGGGEGFFEGDRVAVRRDRQANTRENGRAAFAGHELDTPWDDLHLLYFAGYALWNYLATPFMFTRPGFEVEEIEAWDEGDETWRRLRVEFPRDVPTHCSTQFFYFDRAGLLRRLDYTPDMVSPGSPIPAAHYCYDHEEFSGLVVPRRRRVYPRRDDGMPATDQMVVELDIQDLTAEP